MIRFSIRTFLCAIWLLASGAAAQAEDWPRWRGPNGNGISPESQWQASGFHSEPRLFWKTSVGEGFSSVAVKGKYAYTLGNADEKDTVWCLEAETGKKVWSFSYPCRLGSYPGPRATPAVDEGVVYTLSREGHLFAFDAASGKVRWRRHLVQDFDAEPPGWDFAGSPVVAGQRLVLNAGRAGLALDKSTGAKLWASGRGPGGYAAPVLAELRGKPGVVLFGERAVYGVDLQSGQELWSFDWRTGSDVNAADPVVFDEKVFVASAYSKGCALYDVRGPSPVLLWKSDAFETHFSSFVYLDGYIYGIDGDARQPGAGTLRCLEAATGKPAWSMRLGFGSLIAAGEQGKERLIVLNSAGVIFIAPASPSGYRELAKATLPRDQYWSPPALAQGRLFMRNLSGDLFAIDLR
jgi:outer membrane protein assembly factor BamB